MKKHKNTKTHDKAVELFLPTVDFVFKQLFGDEGSKDSLISLINAVLKRPKDEQVVDVSIINPNIDPTMHREKKSILDIKAEDQKGRIFNIEMQAHQKPAFAERILFYWARLYGKQLESGKNYSLLKPVISISFIDNFELMKDHPSYHALFQLIDKNSGALI